MTGEQWKQILTEWNNSCAYCHKSSKHCELEIEHIVPLCRGGEHDVDNIVPACASCNSSKRERLLDELASSPNSLVTQRLLAWI